MEAALALADPHGDTVATVPVPATGAAVGIEGWVDHDEYGNPLGDTPPVDGAVTDGLGYGWLGAKERATLDTGLMLMGARVYNRATGLFTSVDPIHGGNESGYAHPNDPINVTDLSGLCPWCVPACLRFCAAAGRGLWSGVKAARTAGSRKWTRSRGGISGLMRSTSKSVQKGVGGRKWKVWIRKYPSGGGGVGVDRFGRNVFRVGKSNWKRAGVYVRGIVKYSYHYGKSAKNRRRHRPWE